MWHGMAIIFLDQYAAFLFGLFLFIAILSFFAWRCAKRQRDFDFETFVDEPRKTSNRLHPGTINEAMYQTEMESKDQSGMQTKEVDSKKSRKITERGINETRI